MRRSLLEPQPSTDTSGALAAFLRPTKGKLLLFTILLFLSGAPTYLVESARIQGFVRFYPKRRVTFDYGKR